LIWGLTADEKVEDIDLLSRRLIVLEIGYCRWGRGSFWRWSFDDHDRVGIFVLGIFNVCLLRNESLVVIVCISFILLLLLGAVERALVFLRFADTTLWWTVSWYSWKEN